jgi:cation diffusion facilitator CzcD-associated flavoprotein CzcO
MKIAVIGAGSSGLVTLKYLLDAFPAADIACFEKTDSVRGCWGDQRSDFVSTSTKYTTQFSCFRKWSSDVAPERSFAEFYRGSEFGDYLEAFATHFHLKERIRFGVEVRRLECRDGRWTLLVTRDGRDERPEFDAVFVCTGLAGQRVPVDSKAIRVTEDPEGIHDSIVVVVGGGESATDVAHYLAKPEHHNTVYLSLRSGIRVSPRYHPIRGVPSDFLRNRLLLSFDKRMRNRVGERFVTFRIRWDRLLARWFPHRHANGSGRHGASALRREWDLKLKSRAKGGLFDVFHNKSDDFLDDVGDGRIRIVGPPVDGAWTEYHDFDRSARLEIAADVLATSMGYRSRLGDLSGGALQLREFYRGCVHVRLPKMFLIGFTRPIIGNIPSISEVQARYAVGVLSGKYRLPVNLEERQRTDWELLCAEYPAINTDEVWPVEQFPYCDDLARDMGEWPSRAKVGSLRAWLKIQLAPASTHHYVDAYFDRESIGREKVHMPALIVALLGFMRVLIPAARNTVALPAVVRGRE